MASAGTASATTTARSRITAGNFDTSGTGVAGRPEAGRRRPRTPPPDPAARISAATRVQFPDPADGRAIQLDPGGPPRMQRRVRRLHEPRLSRRNQRFDVTLEIEEVDRPAGTDAPLLVERRAEGDRADVHRLANAADVEIAVLDGRIAREHPPDLEHPHPGLFSIEVVADVGDEAADQRRTHDGELARDRVQEANGVRVAREIALPGVVDEAEVDDLLVVRGGELPRAGRAATAAPRARRA